MHEKLLNHFGLSRVPFVKEIAVNDLYVSQEIKEVCTRLEFALETDSLALITGSSGTGKTTALRYFIHKLDPNVFRIVTITVDTFKIGEIAKLALEGMNIEVPYTASVALRKFRKTIYSFHADDNVKPVIVIDEAQELPSGTLASLKYLLHYDMDSVNRLLIILCSSSEIYDNLKLESLKSLARRIRIRFDVKPLSLEETLRYIKHHLSWAGLKNPVFPEEVLSQIFALSKGVISEINRVCLNLMLLAVQESKDIIELSMIEKARAL